MIRRVTLALVALMVMATAAQAQLKVITEFRGISFGSELSKLQNMSLAEDLNQVRFYKKYGDERSFQGVPLKETVRYGFVDNKLALVIFNAQGPTAFNALKAYFDATYGEPQQPTKNKKHYSYGGGDVTIDVAYNDETKLCDITYTYRPIMAKFGSMKKQ